MQKQFDNKTALSANENWPKNVKLNVYHHYANGTITLFNQSKARDNRSAWVKSGIKLLNIFAWSNFILRLNLLSTRTCQLLSIQPSNTYHAHEGFLNYFHVFFHMCPINYKAVKTFKLLSITGVAFASDKCFL